MLMLEIFSPAVDQSYDFEVDEAFAVGEALTDIVRMISRKCGSDFDGDVTNSSLYDPLKKRELDKDKTFHDNGIRNGMRLILI